jgi:hypothetical protein
LRDEPPRIVIGDYSALTTQDSVQHNLLPPRFVSGDIGIGGCRGSGGRPRC